MITDIEAPSFNGTGNQTVNTDEGKPTAVIKWESASDNSRHVANESCHPPSGTSFTIGQTTVMCVAVDRSGNRAECSFQIYVTGKCLMYVTLLLFRLFMHVCYEENRMN